MKHRKIVIRAAVIIIGLPVVLGLMAWVSFYALVSSFATNRTNRTIVSSGEKREYLLYVPSSYDRPKPTPLVISMHAAMNWPAFQMKLSQWNKAADVASRIHRLR
jgi:poly(3-hydroxybutyrate) depolymerase